MLPNGDRRLLTHAGVLDNYALVQVRRMNDSHKYVASVECVGYDVDIAILQVEDEHFWSSVPSLQLPYGLPNAMTEVLTAGFPSGGEELATTRGVVNRIMLGGQARELCVQVKTASSTFVSAKLMWSPFHLSPSPCLLTSSTCFTLSHGVRDLPRCHGRWTHP